MNLSFSRMPSVAVPKNQIDILLVDPVRCIANTKNYAQYAPKSCTECTPLLARRPLRQGSGNNWAFLSLGVLLIGGLTVGSYLLAQDNRPYPVKYVFDMVDRIVWDTSEISIGPALISSNVQNIYIMQTNGIECDNNVDCVAIVRNMQMMANETQNSDLCYNFLIGGDGETYEIRGWSEQSGFTFIPQNISLTIGMIGTFNDHPPPDSQLTETFALIDESLRRHKILENYRIYGIRNISISATNSEALLKPISSWAHWNSTVNVT